MKTCTKCGESQPLDQFSKKAAARDGLQCQCKVCQKDAAAARYSANPEQPRAASVKWIKAHPEKAKAASVRNAKALREKVEAASPEWVKAYKAELSAACAARYAANPARWRIYCNNARARKAGVAGKLSHGLAAKLFDLQKGLCACCGQPLGDDFHMDHVLPFKLGGRNVDGNIQLLRASCNMSKGARHPDDFMQSRGFLL